MKKFFTIVPLQPAGQLRSIHYAAEGNSRLEMGKETCFPILTAVSGYAEPGEDFRLIAVMKDNENCRRNCGMLREELDTLCSARGFTCSRGVEVISVEQDERISTHVNTFQKLINMVDDEDELFACMTFGTKPMSTVVQMAVQYAYRVKDNTSISCIVYGHFDHVTRTSHVYDMTALVQLDEIVRVLADRHVQDPKAVIDRILAL